ncbi:MAG: hypothetical protein ACUVRZ_07675 [Desulfobacca sp.]
MKSIDIREKPFMLILYGHRDPAVKSLVKGKRHLIMERLVAEGLANCLGQT